MIPRDIFLRTWISQLEANGRGRRKRQRSGGEGREKREERKEKREERREKREGKKCPDQGMLEKRL